MTKTTSPVDAIPPEAQAAIDEASKSGDEVWCLVDVRLGLLGNWIVFRRSATDLTYGLIGYRTNINRHLGWGKIDVARAKDAWERWIGIGAVRVV